MSCSLFNLAIICLQLTLSFLLQLTSWFFRQNRAIFLLPLTASFISYFTSSFLWQGSGDSQRFVNLTTIYLWQLTANCIFICLSQLTTSFLPLLKSNYFRQQSDRQLYLIWQLSIFDSWQPTAALQFEVSFSTNGWQLACGWKSRFKSKAYRPTRSVLWVYNDSFYAGSSLQAVHAIYWTCGSWC